MTIYYLMDDAGQPVPCYDIARWSVWFATVDRHVAETEIEGGVRVSTVFLGLDHNFAADGDPILWETLVFGGWLDGEMNRYTTKHEAHHGHEVMVARVRKVQELRLIEEHVQHEQRLDNDRNAEIAEAEHPDIKW